MGAPDDNGGIGAAWAFGAVGDQWTEQPELVAGAVESGAGKFGASVAIASGGYLALVGAPMSAGGQGQAITFEADYNTHVWSRRQRMDVTGVRVGDHFGASVAMSNNGSAAVVGAPGASSGAGDVHPYTYFDLQSPNWIIQPVIESPAAGANFGATVALAGGGMDVVIGAPLAGNGDGIAYEYRANGSGMQEAVFHDPAGATGGHFGASVAFGSMWSSRVIVGAPGENSGAGAAYDVDDAHGVNWAQQGAALTPAGAPGAGDGYGAAVAMSLDDPPSALIGAPGAGAGDGAATHFISTPMTVPGQPTNVQATAGVESADVTWNAPDSTGGSPISDYTVTSSPGGFTCHPVTIVRSCTVAGLQGGQSHTFTVTASNGVGRRSSSRGARRAVSLPATASTSTWAEPGS